MELKSCVEILDVALLMLTIYEYIEETCNVVQPYSSEYGSERLSYIRNDYYNIR